MNITQDGIDAMQTLYIEYVELSRRINLDVVKFNDFTKNHLVKAKKAFDERYPKFGKLE